MITLSATTQQYYDELLHYDTPKAAWAVIHCFFKEYSFASAEAALWQLLGNTLTLDDLNNKNLPAERLSILSFYEHNKALLYAINTLLATTNADAVLFNPAFNTAPAPTNPTDTAIIETTVTDTQPQTANTAPLPITPAEQQATLHQKKITHFTNSFGKALAFMDAARQVEQQENTIMAAYMLYQCTMLSMRAMIQVFTGENITSHFINELMEELAEHTPVLSAILPENTKEGEELICKLTSLHYNCAYTPGFTVSHTWLSIYFNKANEVLEAARQLGKEILQINTDTTTGNG